ncbi:MAG: DUF6504 family protein [Firmicutes bacterium]|nr:DUF6504 family protein [Bacillota bacterium]
MSKRIQKPITVVEGPGGSPIRFSWLNRWRTVSGVLDRWRESGDWWDGEEERDYFIVATSPGGSYELCRDGPGAWILSRILD